MTTNKQTNTSFRTSDISNKHAHKQKNNQKQYTIWKIRKQQQWETIVFSVVILLLSFVGYGYGPSHCIQSGLLWNRFMAAVALAHGPWYFTFQKLCIRLQNKMFIF